MSAQIKVQSRSQVDGKRTRAFRRTQLIAGAGQARTWVQGREHPAQTRDEDGGDGTKFLRVMRVTGPTMCMMRASECVVFCLGMRIRSITHFGKMRYPH